MQWHQYGAFGPAEVSFLSLSFEVYSFFRNWHDACRPPPSLSLGSLHFIIVTLSCALLYMMLSTLNHDTARCMAMVFDVPTTLASYVVRPHQQIR